MRGLGGDARERFIELMLAHEVLRFGDFTLRSGRRSPYFFDLARIDDGRGMAALGGAYADAVIAACPTPEVVFGPPYKGIPIAVATVMSLYREHGLDAGLAFARKEPKSHGEQGSLIGHPLEGRIVIVDDVMTAGTAVLEAASLLRDHGGELCAVVVALDREELLEGGRTAVQLLEARLAVPVMSIISLSDLIAYLEARSEYRDTLPAIRRYQRAHCLIQQ